MVPVKDAVDSYKLLTEYFDFYILSITPWNNHTAWVDKLNWVKKYLGEHDYKRLILSHHKNLNSREFLVDDRTKNGADRFNGELILFGGDTFLDLNTVTRYLLTKV